MDLPDRLRRDQGDERITTGDEAQDLARERAGPA
jgi:hypothetical protein